MAYDFNQPIADTAEIRVVGVGNGGVKAVRRIAEAQVPGARFVYVHPHEITAEQEVVPEVFASIFPADMILILVVLDDPVAIGMATALAAQGRKRGVLALVIAAQPTSVEQGRALPELEDILREFETAADSVILLERDRLIDSEGSGDIHPEEDSLQFEQAFLMAVRTCVEPITVPGIIGVDFSDVRARLTGGGLSIIGFGWGHGDYAAEDAVEMALGKSVQRASLFDYRNFLVWTAGSDACSTLTLNRAALWFQKSISVAATAIFAVTIDHALARESFLFNFIASGKRLRNAEERTPT